MRLAAILLLAAVASASTFHEKFDAGWDSRWVHSSDGKYEGKFVVENPVSELEDAALKVPEKAKHYGIATVLPEVMDPSDKPLVFQFEVKLADGLSCGGAYMKFLTADSSFSASDLKDDTPYTVMFGPDKCGATNKVHLIVRHESPKTKEIQEKHLRFPPVVVDDGLTHVYTAVLYPSNNSYAVLIDGDEKKGGSLFEDFDPPFVPPTEIDDPEDSKPEDWVDEAKIPDPDAEKPEEWDEDAPEFVEDEEATKPEGWLDDEPSEVPDADATKPEDWDDEEDGDWEPPMVPNPKCKDAPGCGEWVRPTKPNPEYKGKWSPPMIDNPEYKGPWLPRKIPNPDFYNDTTPLSHIGKVGAAAIEIWTMDENYFFDNIVVSDSFPAADAVMQETWAIKYKIEKETKEQEEAKQEALDSSKLEMLKDKVAMGVENFFESKLLSPYSQKLEFIRDPLQRNPLALMGVFAAMVLGGLALAVMQVLAVVKKQKEAVAVGAAKKKDGPAPTPAKKAAAANGKDKGEGEIEEEDEDDTDDAAPSTAVRQRRPRRD